MSSAKGIGDRSKTTLSFCSVSVGAIGSPSKTKLLVCSVGVDARAVGSDDDVTISFS